MCTAVLGSSLNKLDLECDRHFVADENAAGFEDCLVGETKIFSIDLHGGGESNALVPHGSFCCALGPSTLRSGTASRSVLAFELHQERGEAATKSFDAPLLLGVFQGPIRVERLVRLGDDELKVAGDLTIRGVTRNVVFNVEGPTAPAKDPWGGTRIGLTATTKINRKDFGLIWNAALETGGILVGDEVTITLEVEFVKA